MKLLLSLCLLLYLSGCTTVAVREPIGTPLPDSEYAKFVGIAVGADGVVTLSKGLEKGQLLLKTEDSEDSPDLFITITQLTMPNKQPASIGWLSIGDELKGYIPFKIVDYIDGDFCIYYLDSDVIEAMIDANQLTEVQVDAEGEKIPDGVIMLSADKLESVLAGREAWNIEAPVFYRRVGAQQGAVAPKATSDERFFGEWVGTMAMSDGDKMPIRLVIKDGEFTQYFKTDGEWIPTNPAISYYHQLGDTLLVGWLNQGGIWTENQMYSLTYTDGSILDVVWTRHVTNRDAGEDGKSWNVRGEGKLVNIE